MKEHYVSYDCAVKLKELGFDWPTSHYYCAFDNETDVRLWNIHPKQSQNTFRAPKDTVIADAPRLDQAQAWLREVKNMDVLVFNNACGYEWEISKSDPESRGTGIAFFDDGGEDKASGMWLSYESALSAGIDAALKLLGKEDKE